ncbi:MAG: hypothetical protein LJE57_01515 [Gallionella sp.]|nr:hypothetical protein [Gallionella sp.]
METWISASHFTRAQATMLKLGLGLMLVGYAISSHAAPAGFDNSAPGFDVISLPLAFSVTGVDQSSGLTKNDQLPGRFGFGKLPDLRPYFDLKKVTAWVASIRWHVSEEDSHPSFSPRLQVESRNNLISIRPTSHSITVEWSTKLD